MADESTVKRCEACVCAQEGLRTDAIHICGARTVAFQRFIDALTRDGDVVIEDFGPARPLSFPEALVLREKYDRRRRSLQKEDPDA